MTKPPRISKSGRPTSATPSFSLRANGPDRARASLHAPMRGIPGGAVAPTGDRRCQIYVRRTRKSCIVGRDCRGFRIPIAVHFPLRLFNLTTRRRGLIRNALETDQQYHLAPRNSGESAIEIAQRMAQARRKPCSLTATASLVRCADRGG